MKLAGSQILLKRRQSDVERMRIARYNFEESDWVEMRINPQRISITSRKVIQRVQTNTRWVFQHWGMEPILIRYSGVTGYIKSIVSEVYTDLYLPRGQEYDINVKNEDPVVEDRYVSPYETPAFQALMALREFYEKPHEQLQGVDLTQISGADVDENLRRLLLKLTYRDGNYIGYLTMMEIQEEENSPWMWNYNMEFVALYHRTRMSVTSQDIASLVRVLFALTPGFDASSDTALQNAWRRGVVATTGSTDPRNLYSNSS